MVCKKTEKTKLTANLWLTHIICSKKWPKNAFSSTQKIGSTRDCVEREYYYYSLLTFTIPCLVCLQSKDLASRYSSGKWNIKESSCCWVNTRGLFTWGLAWRPPPWSGSHLRPSIAGSRSWPGCRTGGPACRRSWCLPWRSPWIRWRRTWAVAQG